MRRSYYHFFIIKLLKQICLSDDEWIIREVIKWLSKIDDFFFFVNTKHTYFFN